jgi:YVTN family beta-propeller protein
MKSKVALALTGALTLWGCSSNNGAYRPATGSVAMSRDGKLVYAVDTDNQKLMVVDASSNAKVSEVPVGKAPSRITVGLDDHIYVANHGERSVSVIEKGTWKELARIPTGVEPNGLALSEDGKELYIVSATDLNDPQHGTMAAVDTVSLQQKWQVNVGSEPRAVTVAQGKAYVSNLNEGRVTVVSLANQQVTSSIDLNNSDNPDPVANPSSASAGLVADLTAAPDGHRVYAAHVWERNGDITVPLGAVSGYYAQGSPCGIDSVVSPAVGTVDVDQSQVDSFTTCLATGALDNNVDFPPSVLFPDRTTGVVVSPIQEPVGVVVDPTNSWLFVLNRSSQNVAVMPTHKRPQTDPTAANVSTLVSVGNGADGMAMSNDGKSLYVYNQFDHTLSVIQHVESSSDPMALAVTSKVTLAGDTLSPSNVVGRKMFYSATDRRISSAAVSTSCASCHTAGMSDGHVWRFPDGPRTTPALAGRALNKTAPYHWTGIFPTITDFYNETIIRRMGGTGLSSTDADPLSNYIYSLPSPENPLQNRSDLADALSRGQQAFAKAGCEQCHTSSNGLYTDNSIHNVGTIGPTDTLENLGAGFDNGEDQLTGFNVPSLLGLGRHSPYLHDGSIPTVRARIDASRSPKHDGTDHGDTSVLNDQEISDLETYLLSL